MLTNSPTRFEYKPNPALGQLRVRLAQLREQRQDMGASVGGLRERADEAQSALLAVETRAAIGEAKPAEVQAARAAFEQARAAVEAYKPTGRVLAGEVKAVAGQVEELARQELDANKPAYLAGRRAIIAELDTALRAAAEANAKLATWDASAGELGRWQPGGAWPEFIANKGYGYYSPSQLEPWEAGLRKAGQLE